MAAGFKHILFHVEHLNCMEVREREKGTILANDRIMNMLTTYSGKMDAETILYDGRIIACMGFIEIVPGVVEVWLIPSIYVKSIPKLFLKTVKSRLEVLASTLGFHRMQTIGLIDEASEKWMEWLGFVREGVMVQYLNKKDYIIWARCFV